MTEKKAFLVVYDYGMGGLWGVIMAKSAAEISDRYPELAVVTDRPLWMSEEYYRQLCEVELHDLDETPWGVINVVLADRKNQPRD